MAMGMVIEEISITSRININNSPNSSTKETINNRTINSTVWIEQLQ